MKAFKIYGFENLEKNTYADYSVKPVMLFCGNDATAKQMVSTLIEQMGW